MAHRLPAGGRRVDRARPLSFRWNGRRLEGFAGDTLASALLGAGETLVGRSFKYHRPRGVLAAGVEEPNALVGLGRGPRFEPNARATTVELFEGLEATSQNHWPSLGFDVGAVNAAVASVAPVFPAGFYYKTFMRPAAAWKRLYEPAIRAAAGLGRAPTEPDGDSYEQLHAFCDVLVVGGGPAGLTAARAAGEAGARVLLVEQAPWLGGRALAEEAVVDGLPLADWAAREAAALAAMGNVTLRARTTAAGLYDHGFAVLEERLGDHDPARAGPRRRLWKVRARRIVVAAGAFERPICFACNDVPGVMLASAVRDYLALWGVAAGRRLAVFTLCDDGYSTALAARAAGLDVTVLDARPAAGPRAEAARAAGAALRFGVGVTRALGGKRLEAVEIAPLRASGRPAAVQTLEADALAMAGGWSPAAHLYCHAGGRLAWDEALIAFRPDPAHAPIGPDGAPNTRCAGAANGAVGLAATLADARAAGSEAAAACGFTGAAPDLPAVEEPAEAPPRTLWIAPGRGRYVHGTKHFVDFQNDVTAADVELAAREGYESVEHAKRYTTLGMATDQGKTSNVVGLAILADALGAAISQVGVTTFRPPWRPVALGAVAGAATGPLFKPLRRTPMDGWHDARGAAWEPVGDWRRPYAYPAKGEDRAAAVAREVLTVRRAAGMLDASTLGKLMVKGPDAGAFLDRVYTGVMSTLKPGRCRYGLMCTDQGFLFDDGVVARLGPDVFLLHTTSGGADRVHGWLEEWLQTEWPDLRVHVANLTEQYAQIALAGPEARAVLTRVGTDIDLDGGAFRFLDWREGRVAGAPARVFRISYSGELSYEIATPAGWGLGLWEALAAAGAQPYGTEALHVLRAEKGFIAIGDETDGTVTPHDLGLSWAVADGKPDFIGKRALRRSFLTRSDRPQLVGLLTEDPAVVLPDGAPAVERTGDRPPVADLGRVTSTYFSPTLDRSIALGLIRAGRARLGQTLQFSTGPGAFVAAKLVEPAFHDPEGARLHG